MTATLRRSPRPHLAAPGATEVAPRPRRRQLVVLAALVLWLLASGALLGLAHRRAMQGVREMAAARRSVATTALDDGILVLHLDRARERFGAAAQEATSPLLLPARALPVIGRQLQAFTSLVRAAELTARTGEATVDNAQSAMAGAPTTGAGRVAVIRELADVASRADAEFSRVSLGPSHALVGPLRRGRVQLDHELGATRDGLRRATQVLTAVGALLEGPRHYLVLAANEAEMRAGSGMFLSAGTLESDQGSLTLGPMRPTGDLALGDAGVTIDGDLAARWGWLEPGREWRNLGATPRFDVTAPVAARMWESLTGESVDGVLALDVDLLRAVLEAVGPVTVDDHVVTDATVVPCVLHDQYAGLDYDDAQGARREQLGRIAGATLAAAQDRAYSLTSLARAFATASGGRHFLAWSAQPAEQRAWQLAGIDGGLSPTSLALNVMNRGGNKLDPFLAVAATLEVQSTGPTTSLALHVDVRNQTPSGQSPYVAGPHPQSGAGPGDYVGILAVNVPERALDLAMEGTSRLVAAGPDGPTQVVAAPLLLRPGEEASFVVRFRLPAADHAVTVVPSARIPPITWRAGTQQWADTSGRVVRWP